MMCPLTCRLIWPQVLGWIRRAAVGQVGGSGVDALALWAVPSSPAGLQRGGGPRLLATLDLTPHVRHVPTTFLPYSYHVTTTCLPCSCHVPNGWLCLCRDPHTQSPMCLLSCTLHRLCTGLSSSAIFHHDPPCSSVFCHAPMYFAMPHHAPSCSIMFCHLPTCSNVSHVPHL